MRPRSPLLTEAGRRIATLAATLQLACALAGVWPARAQETAASPSAPVEPAAAPAGEAMAVVAPDSAHAGAALAPPPPPAAPAPSPAAAAARFATPRISPPRDLNHIGEWIAYRNARHLAALPVESRLFYRRGLIAKRAGDADGAMVLVRGAEELDPAFVSPHLTLATWMFLSEPSQALKQCADIVELVRQDFNLQLALAANGTLVALEALFTALLFACLMIVWLRREELVHAWRERLAAAMGTSMAHAWAIGVFALPFFTGFGLTLPALALLGYLWPVLRLSERAASVLLLAMVLGSPFALSAVERFSLPLHGEAPPFYDVPRLENMPYSAEAETRLGSLAKQHPGNGLLQFGHAWVARRGGHLTAAETAYRDMLKRWPRDDRAITNLGNVLAMQGRIDEALEQYQRAIAVNPGNAAAWFNSAQLHTQRFEYQSATDALAKASALNFELVRSYQSQSTTDGLLPLIDLWLQPNLLWATLQATPTRHDATGAAPFRLRGRIEAKGWWFSIAAILALAAGIAFGYRQHRRIHLRQCSNCGTVVCRRCSERRRELALCPACAMAQAGANTPEQGRVLLMAHRRDRNKRLRWIELALATLIPGFGLMSQRRVFAATFIVALAWLAFMAWHGTPPPFSLEPRLALPGDDLPAYAPAAALGLVYLISLLGYLGAPKPKDVASEEPPIERGGRPTQASARTLNEAA